MPFIYSPTRTGERVFGPSLPSTASEVRTEQFAEAFETSPALGAIPRALNLLSDRQQGTRLDQAAATKEIEASGLGGRLTVGEGGITDRALTTLIDRKRVEMRRQEVFANSEGGFWEGAQGLGIGLVTGLADPINVASGFVPVISRGAYLARLASQSSLVGRTAVRAGVGAIEGAVGAALIEPLIAGSRAYEQADYGALDSLLNVTLGSVLGAGLHTTLGAAAEGVGRLRGTLPEWRGLGGLTGDEATSVLNMRDELRAGLDPKTAGIALETSTGPQQRALAQELTPAQVAALPESTGTALRDAKAINEQVGAIESMSPVQQEALLRAVVTQAVIGEPINADGALAGITGRTADGVLTAELTPGAFRPEGKRSAISDMQSAVMRRLNERLTEPDSPRRAREISQLQEMQSTLVRFEQNLAAPSSRESEQLRQAAVMQALDAGVPVPPRALAGLDGKTQRLAADVSAAAARDAPSRRQSDPGIDAERQAALDHADEVLARETERNPATESDDELAAAREETQIATAELDATKKRLGIETDDPIVLATDAEAAKAERWAKAMDVAVVCVLRGD